MPELTDEWVAENLGEFETVDEWRASIAERLSSGKLNRVRQQLVPKVTEALTGLVDIEPPSDGQQRPADRGSRTPSASSQAQGIDLGGGCRPPARIRNSFFEGLRGSRSRPSRPTSPCGRSPRPRRSRSTTTTLEAEYARIAMQVGQKAKDIRKAYEQNDAVPELVAQIRKSKALDWLLHHVEIVDPDGKPIDRELVLGHTHDDDDEAHDHDHDRSRSRSTPITTTIPTPKTPITEDAPA